jgi:hypothetical protein
MALRMTEYGGVLSGRPLSDFVMEQPAIRTQVSTAASGGGASTMFCSSGTRSVQLGADAGGGGFYVLFTSTTSSVAASSTNAVYVPAAVAPIPFFVAANMRVVSVST